MTLLSLIPFNEFSSPIFKKSVLFLDKHKRPFMIWLLPPCYCISPLSPIHSFCFNLNCLEVSQTCPSTSHLPIFWTDWCICLEWSFLLRPLTNFSSVSENFINITLYMYLPTAIPTQSTEIPYMPALTFFSSCSSLQHGGPHQSSGSLKDVLVIFISVF